MVGALAHDHLADHAVRDGLFRLPPLVGGSGLRSDLQHAPGLLHGRDQHVSFLDGVAHRLFQIHVLAVIHRLQRNVRVPVIRRRDDHRVDILTVDNLVVIEITVALVMFLIGGDALLIRVRDGDNLAGVILLADLGESVADVSAAPADADDANGNAVIGADDASARTGAAALGRLRRSESGLSGSQSDADGARLAQKIPAIE